MGVAGAEVFLAMSQEQADYEGCYRCMHEEFADSFELYFQLDQIPEELCTYRKIDWEKEICMKKSDFLTLTRKWKVKLTPTQIDFLNHVKGEYIWLIGFGG